MLYLLLFPADRIDVAVGVIIGWHCEHALIGVVRVAAEVLLWQLSVPAVVLSDIGLAVVVGIVLWGLVGSFQAWQVVLKYLQIVVQIPAGGILWCFK